MCGEIQSVFMKLHAKTNHNLINMQINFRDPEKNGAFLLAIAFADLISVGIHFSLVEHNTNGYCGHCFHLSLFHIMYKK